MNLTHCSRRWVVSLVALVALHGPPPAEPALRESSSERLLVLLRDASALAIVDPARWHRAWAGADRTRSARGDGVPGRTASRSWPVPAMGFPWIDIATQREIRRVNPGPGSGPHDVLFADGKVYFTIEGYKSIGRYDPEADQIDWTLGNRPGWHSSAGSRQ